MTDDGELRRLLRELTGVSRPPGSEGEAAEWVATQLPDVQFTTDRNGQLAGRFGPDGDVGLLLSAHLDEVGLVVSRVDADGFVRVLRVGGVPERVLPGTHVRLLGRDGPVPGVVGVKSHHLTPPEEKYKAQPAEELYVDVGLPGARAVLDAGILVGTRVTYEPAWTELGGGRIAAKGLDDALGVVALIEVARELSRRPPPRPVVVGFTTQEEFHVRGALSLALAHRPAALVNIDVSPATDTPDLAGRHSPVLLGGGPVMNVMSFHGRGTLGGLIPNDRLVGLLEDTARVSGIHMQREAIIGLITDAAFVPMSTPQGVACASLGIPCRYTHSPVETAHLQDLDQTIGLLHAAIPALSQAFE